MVVNNNNIGAGEAQVTPRAYITIGARLIKTANRRLFQFLPICHQSAQSVLRLHVLWRDNWLAMVYTLRDRLRSTVEVK